MSGICGIFRPREQPIQPDELDRILRPLEQRGPDGTNSTIIGHVGLGHTLLATTPEAAHEKLPLTDQSTGCTITADVRLDNREDLFAALNLSDDGATGDGQLILLAYHKWGDACAQHLRGDFAFAIWDPRKEQLFCARDQVGMRQLIYTHSDNGMFAFATEPRALLAHPDIPCQVNEARIADFFEHFEARDLTSTFFLDLHKLAPAHALICDSEGVRIWRYWQMRPQPILELPDDTAYAKAFLDVFTDAVRSRLRAAGPVGSMLSGGMDSGSVSAIAARLLQDSDAPALKTFSAIRDDPDCVESRTIKAALSIEAIDPNFASLDAMDDYRAELMRLTQTVQEPFDGHMTMLRAIYMTAHSQGVKVMLDGVGGDTTLGSEEMVGWHLDHGNFRQALREARGEKHFWGKTIKPWPSHIRRALRRFVPESLLENRRARLEKQKNRRIVQSSALAPDFAARIGMAKLREENARHVATPKEFEARKIKRALHPYVVVARERYDRTASALAIEPRDPFLDLRVIEFCLSLPQEQLQKDGWPKIILRQAMDGILPDSVRWRIGKEHLGWEFTRDLWTENTDQIQLSDMNIAATYLANRTLHRDSGNRIESNLEDGLQAKYIEIWWEGFC